MSSFNNYLTTIFPVGTTGSMSGTSTIHSQVFDMRKNEGCSFQPIWTGTPTGTITIEVSLDYVPNLQSSTPINAGTWTNIGASIPTQPAGSSGSTFIPIYAACTAWIRLTYVNASGTGAMSGMFMSKTRG